MLVGFLLETFLYQKGDHGRIEEKLKGHQRDSMYICAQTGLHSVDGE